MTASGLTREEVAQVYERYGYFLRRRALLITRDAGLADDAVQEVLVKLLRKGARLRDADHPLRFLHRVVDRSAIDQLRRGRQLRSAQGMDEEALRLPAPPSVDHELRDAVLRALAALNDTDKQIAILSWVDGMNQGQVAEEVGLSRVTVNKRVQRIREHARRQLDSQPALETP